MSSKLKFGRDSAHEEIFSGAEDMARFRYWRNGPRGAELKLRFSDRLFEVYGDDLGLFREDSDRLFELVWQHESDPRRIENNYVVFSELIDSVAETEEGDAPHGS